MTARISWAACALALTTQGCAWGEGRGFTTLEETRVSARIDRDDGGSPAELTTDRGYLVHLESAELFVEDVALEQGNAEPEAAHFDPAHPPEGYSLCHGGHCHSEDGRLVPYEEIEQERAGAGTAYATVVSIPVNSRVDLLGGDLVRVREASPSRELPRAELQRLTLHAGSLHVRGSVRAGAAAEALPLSVDLEAHTSMQLAVHADIDRDMPSAVRAVVVVAVPRTLFDGVDFGRLAEQGSVTLADAESPHAEPLLRALAASELRFELH